jgi:hypothetical protein
MSNSALRSQTVHEAPTRSALSLRRMAARCARLAFATLLLLVSGDASAQSTDRVVVVPANTTLVSFSELARRVAPVLWFSEDEPAQKDGLFPTTLDSDSGQRRVVYFKAVARTFSPEAICQAVNRPGALHGPRLCRSRDVGPDTPLRIANLSDVRIRFFFYYQQDYGFGSHPHDLEALDIEIQNIDGSLALTKVAGSAHGQGWYSNELRLDAGDTFLLPVHALVEEGKHATAPDRNADGTYTPYYDVSHYPADAWGIRDSLNGRFQPGNRFVASMMKRRVDRMKIYPPGRGGKNDEYSLLHSVEQPVCDGSNPIGVVASHVPGGLRGLLKNKTFCRAGFGPSSAFDDLLPTLRPFMRTPLELFTMGYRVEGNGAFVSVSYAIPHITVFRVPGLDGWLKPQLMVATQGDGTVYQLEPTEPRTDGALALRRVSNTSRVEVQLAPSASRLFDWFMTVGFDWERQEILLDSQGNEIVVHGFEKVSRFLAEHATLGAGVVVHVPIPDDWLGGQLPPVVQVKLGLVTDEFKVLRHPRVMFQVGVGVF